MCWSPATSSSTRRRCRPTGANSPSSPGSTSGRQIWIAASTHDGEERIAAEAHKRLAEVFPDALTLIAPRHPERGEAILRELQGPGPCLRAALARRATGPRTAVYICDTIGELGLFYRLAGVVFVGKSFVGGGGQNPIEPARLASRHPAWAAWSTISPTLMRRSTMPAAR